MIIHYGISSTCIDLTHICRTTLNRNHIITIPQGDSERAKYFTDPLIGVHKKYSLRIKIKPLNMMNLSA
jgi:hypothetical protein